MKILDPALLKVFRARQRCEVCNAAGVVQPHHLWARGIGGGGRIDIAENLIAVCPNCHRLIHDGHLKRCLLVTIVALREGTTPELIEQKIHEIRRRRK